MTEIRVEGHLRKMQTQLKETVDYHLPVGEELLGLNKLLNYKIKISYDGRINCIHCQRKTNKSFNQGYCYPCFKRLAQCDSCIMSPEKCHYFSGTCREPQWADDHCMQDHFVYLANSSGIKVGITRGNQIPTRWMDQGAVQALPIFRVNNRLQSGLVEVLFKEFIADKTNWRKMLKGDIEPVDLLAERSRLLQQARINLSELQQRIGSDCIEPITDAKPVNIDYPVLEYPTKISSFNLDKHAVVEGVLKGIKGQYLILDTGVINIRKYTGYSVAVQCEKQ